MEQSGRPIFSSRGRPSVQASNTPRPQADPAPAPPPPAPMAVARGRPVFGRAAAAPAAVEAPRAVEHQSSGSAAPAAPTITPPAESAASDSHSSTPPQVANSRPSFGSGRRQFVDDDSPPADAFGLDGDDDDGAPPVRMGRPVFGTRPEGGLATGSRAKGRKPKRSLAGSTSCAQSTIGPWARSGTRNESR